MGRRWLLNLGSIVVFPYVAVRQKGGLIITPSTAGMRQPLGTNINGPSLIRVPEWIENRLGRYYLYFAHHHGDRILMAYGDRLEGPWRNYENGVLDMARTPAQGHIASPDVHVDEDSKGIRMYFHGPVTDDGRRQATFIAQSRDGLSFSARREPLGPFYFRVFEHDGWFCALARKGPGGGVLLRSPGPAGPFEEGPSCIRRMRHAAVLRRGASLWIIFSRIGDAPESLLAAEMRLNGHWRTWKVSEPEVLLRPEMPYEGSDQPVAESQPGAARGRVRQLRDPAVFAEGDRTYLLYAVAGEQGIALAELVARGAGGPSRDAQQRRRPMPDDLP